MKGSRHAQRAEPPRRRRRPQPEQPPRWAAVPTRAARRKKASDPAGTHPPPPARLHPPTKTKGEEGRDPHRCAATSTSRPPPRRRPPVAEAARSPHPPRLDLAAAFTTPAVPHQGVARHAATAPARHHQRRCDAARWSPTEAPPPGPGPSARAGHPARGDERGPAAAGGDRASPGSALWRRRGRRGALTAVVRSPSPSPAGATREGIRYYTEHQR